MGRLNSLQKLLIFSLIVTIWSLIRPYDYGVWLFETIVGFVGLLILTITNRRFPFSNLVYFLVGIHFLILATGGKYTYAEMPLFNWLKEVLHLQRNYFDRVGHFCQGFMPVIITREFLLRQSPLGRGKLLNFISVSICFSISAFWELLEWWIVIFCYPQQGQEWLGMQGDVWDAQKDMFMALIGASLALLLLSRLHDRSLAKLMINE